MEDTSLVRGPIGASPHVASEECIGPVRPIVNKGPVSVVSACCVYRGLWALANAGIHDSHVFKLAKALAAVCKLSRDVYNVYNGYLTVFWV